MAARKILTRQCLLDVTRRAYSSGADKNVAFLGLGNMGGFMAANLVKQVSPSNLKLGQVQHKSVDQLMFIQNVFLGAVTLAW